MKRKWYVRSPHRKVSRRALSGKRLEVIAIAISTCAVLVSLWQTNLVKSQLTAADRNRSLEAVVTGLGRYCEALANGPYAFTLTRRKLKNGNKKLRHFQAFYPLKPGRKIDTVEYKAFLDSVQSTSASFIEGYRSARIWMRRSVSIENAYDFVDNTNSAFEKSGRLERMLSPRSLALSRFECSKIANSIIAEHVDGLPVKEKPYDYFRQFWRGEVCLDGESILCGRVIGADAKGDIYPAP